MGSALRGSLFGRHRGVLRPTLPCPRGHSSVLALVADVDVTVASWQRDGDDTVERLHLLSDRRWRPPDVSTIDGYCRQLKGWTVRTAELAAPPIPQSEPCLTAAEVDAREEMARVEASTLTTRRRHGREPYLATLIAKFQEGVATKIAN